MILADINPFQKSHPYRVSSYRHCFDEKNFSNTNILFEFIRCDFHRIKNLKKLPINIFELYFFIKWVISIRYKIYFQIKFVKTFRKEFLTFWYIKINSFSWKKLLVFSCKQISKLVSADSLRSYSSRNTLKKHKRICEEQEKTSIQTSIESHMY